MRNASECGMRNAECGIEDYRWFPVGPCPVEESVAVVRTADPTPAVGPPQPRRVRCADHEQHYPPDELLQRHTLCPVPFPVFIPHSALRIPHLSDVRGC